MTRTMCGEDLHIPSEILLRIFFEFMTYNLNKPGALIRLALVCRRWQDMACKHYRFWVDLMGLDIPKSFLGELLPNCSMATVSLTHRARTPLFHEILAAQLYRIDSLDLLIPVSLCIPIINSLNTSAPDLGTLKLKLLHGVDSFPIQYQVPGDRTLPLTFFGGCTPVLRSVELSGFTMPLSPAVFRGMHSIDLGPWNPSNPLSLPQYHAIGLLDALHNAPSLESIVLTDCIRISDSNLSTDLIADLPNLKRLDLTGVSSAILNFVLAIALPSSCKIKLCGRTPGDYRTLWARFMKGLTFPTTRSMCLTIEIMWGRVCLHVDGKGLTWNMAASFPDSGGHLLVSASSLFPMDRISEIIVKGDNTYNLCLAWSSFLLSWKHVCTLALSGRSAVDLLDALSHLDTNAGALRDLSVLHLSYVDFGMESGGLHMTMAGCLQECLVRARGCSLTLIVNVCCTTEQVLGYILEHGDQEVELEWDGEEDFSETESLGYEEDELEWDGEEEFSEPGALMNGEEE